jgi:hypothetical protein
VNEKMEASTSDPCLRKWIGMPVAFRHIASHQQDARQMPSENKNENVIIIFSSRLDYTLSKKGLIIALSVTSSCSWGFESEEDG